MMELNNELLNKFVDNELSSAELVELQKLIDENPEEFKKLKAHKLVDEILKTLQPDAAPVSVTAKIMNRINASMPQKYESNNFFRYVLGAVGLFLLASIGYSISMLSVESSTENTPSFLESLNISDFINSSYNQVTSFLANTNILYIGMFLTVTILITFYFVIESHKSFKKKIEQMAH